MQQTKGYQAFANMIFGKTISLIGLGVSNLPLVAFLYSCGAAKVLVRDLKKSEEDPSVIKAKENGAEVLLGENYLKDLSEDLIIRSPGIRPDIPPFLEAAKNGSRITCETELFLEFVPCKSIAITGSDGKTTTTTLVSKILEAMGKKVFLGGNIGASMLPQLADMDESCVSVSELSSFQLMNCKFSPDISIITNLSENHLDWHRDMNEYLDAKKNILSHQNQNSIAVLNFDNIHTKVCQTKGRKIYFCYDSESLFSQTSPKEDAIYYQDGSIFIRKNEKTAKVLSTDSILLPGKHNVENYMAAIAAVYDLVDHKAIETVAKTFGGVEHRIELIREKNGVKYYNSSIDSSPARSTAALRSFRQKVIMIAGGYDKKLDYSGLGNEICEHVKTLILCGATSEKIKNAVLNSSLYKENEPKILESGDFHMLAKIAEKEAKNGDVVILSPASASFDMFKNFDERGKLFKKLVMEL
jgi:UDP-N-acetylmuramoylalanine--D-glutamate ligase